MLAPAKRAIERLGCLDPIQCNSRTSVSCPTEYFALRSDFQPLSLSYVAPGTGHVAFELSPRQGSLCGSDRGNLAKASSWRCRDTCKVPMKFVSDRPRAVLAVRALAHRQCRERVLKSTAYCCACEERVVEIA